MILYCKFCEDTISFFQVMLVCHFCTTQKNRHCLILYYIIHLYANMSSLAWLKVCQEPPVLEVHTWRTLKVPDWILGGWGHHWHHGSSWYVIIDLCAKCQLSSMIRSMSRTPCPRSPYFEDISGSCMGSWRIGLSLISWIVMICDS